MGWVGWVVAHVILVSAHVLDLAVHLVNFLSQGPCGDVQAAMWWWPM